MMVVDPEVQKVAETTDAEAQETVGRRGGDSSSVHPQNVSCGKQK
jgi:hypothetical protein